MSITEVMEESVKESKDLQRRWLLAVLQVYECDGEGLLDDLQITLDRGETFEQFADQCLEYCGDVVDPAKEKRKFDR